MAKGETAQRIQQATVAAMKAREKERLGVLRMLQAAIKQVEVDERRELEEDDVLKALAGYARKVKDQIAAARESGRTDLLERAEQEMALVNMFLPAELSDAELERIVRAAIADVGATGPRDLGKVMKAVLPEVTGRAEGARVSGLVKKLLQS
jgi:uncharacterized protein YqeY